MSNYYENNFTIPQGYTIREIEEKEGVTYVGYSILRTPTDSNKWIIKKIDESVTNFITITYSEGSWDNRTNLNYN